jgi:hypothetical protein
LDPHDSIADPDSVGNKNNPVIFFVKSKNKMSFFLFTVPFDIFGRGVFTVLIPERSASVWFSTNLMKLNE